jgi:ACS family tartrate transporter-like MFS transporter
MKVIWRRPAASLAERTRRRVTVHLVPVLFCLYILAYLDRVNISVAQLGMEKPIAEGGLGFDPQVIGIGAGLFFWGYWILEIPSTLSVVKWGARWVFCRILVLWGICATVVGFIGLPLCTWMFDWIPHLSGDGAVAQFVNSLSHDAKNQFYVFRFMLGFFEGGFFPSVIVYLSLWFRAADRAKAIATFMAAIPLSSAVGLPASALLLPVDWLGLAGWRWVFIIEGILPILAGFAVLFTLPDRPAKARWLPADERAFLEAELEAEQRAKQTSHHFAWVHHLGTVLLLTFVYFCLNVNSYGLGMFMPAIIKSQSGASDQVAAYLAALPFCTALVAMLLNGWHSDRQGERIWHVAIPLALCGIGIFACSLTNQLGIVPVAIMILAVGPCLYAHLPAFWPIPTMFLGSAAAASAIGFINMMGNLGGYYGPSMVGKLATSEQNFAGGLLRLAPWPLMAAAVILVVGYFRRRTLRGGNS